MPLIVAINASLVLAICFLLFLANIIAQEPSVTGLAKATQNPLAAMSSLQFQNNITFNVGPHKRTQSVVNIQPVLPINLVKIY